MRKSKSTDPNISEEEKNFEQSLRPLSIKDFSGRKRSQIILMYLYQQRK